MTDNEFRGSFIDDDGARCISTPRGPVVSIGPPLTPDDVDRAQDALGCTLPPDYRRWLLLCNGGIPEWGKYRKAYFAWSDDGLTRADAVDTLLGISHPNPRIDLLADNAARQGVIPPGTISIGKPNFQDEDRRFCLGVEGEHRGKVFDWFIQRPRKRRGVTPEPIVRCFERFPSFEAFWDSLLTEFPHTPPKVRGGA